MSIQRTIVALLVLAVVTSLLGATAASGATGTPTDELPLVGRGDPPINGLFAAEERPNSPAPTRDRILAQIDRENHRLTFVQHTEIDTIGVYESAPLGATPYLTAMTGGPAGQKVTALQLYEALTEVEAPPVLVTDHARSGGASDKKLVVPDVSHGQDPTDGSCEFNQAFAYDSQWASNWHFGIGQQHDLHAQLSFHDDINGNVGKVFDANKSSARWLAACNGDHVADQPDIYLQPISVQNGVPHTHYAPHVEPFTQEIYWSTGGPEHWQLRMLEGWEYNTHSVRNWAIGGAIDKPLGFVVPGD